jgi:Asp-tRNA(Asn)/Glu-tRNA(Gln) amidotransferase A subunit family amidase
VEEALYYRSIGELTALIQSTELSPVGIVDACLARIDTLNPKLNAFITVATSEAREHAKAPEAEIKAGKWRGPLHGVPVGVKDFYDTANLRTTAAFEPFKNRVPSTTPQQSRNWRTRAHSRRRENPRDHPLALASGNHDAQRGGHGDRVEDTCGIA